MKHGVHKIAPCNAVTGDTRAVAPGAECGARPGPFHAALIHLLCCPPHRVDISSTVLGSNPSGTHCC